jgi:hypothetical protein
MPRTCTVCSHNSRRKVDAAIVSADERDGAIEDDLIELAILPEAER